MINTNNVADLMDQQKEVTPRIVLGLLWKKYKRQSVYGKILTLSLILLVIIWSVLFYSSFLIKEAIYFILKISVLRAITWYVRRSET
jgi:hypothetical protein